MRKSYIVDRLPFFGIEQKLLVYSDGSIGAGFRVMGMDITAASAEEINSFCKKVEQFLVGLPERCRLQVFYKLSSDASQIIEGHREILKGSEALYMPVAESRMGFIDEKAKSAGYFLPETYLFVRSEPLQMKKRKLLERARQFENFPPVEFQKHCERFRTFVDHVESAIGALGLFPRRLSPQEWFALCFSYFNFDRSVSVGIPALSESENPLSPPMASQLALTDIQVSEKQLSVGKFQFRVMSLAMLPEGHTYASMIEALTKLPFHFWLSQNIEIPEQRKEIEKLELMRRIASSMSSGSQNVSDIESESKLESLETLLRELMNGSEKLVSSTLNMIFWGNSEEELDNKQEEIFRAFRALNQAEGFVETFALEEAFFNSAPGVCVGFRPKKMKSSNCAHLMPLFAAWTGNERPVILLSHRDGSPFALDLFSPDLPNWNGVVFGGSGSGKSFSVAQLMLQFCVQKPKPKIVWIDNGASSQKLIEVLGGEFIDLNLNSPICLNMFDIDGTGSRPSESRLKLILACLELILKDSNQEGLPKREKALLEECILRCFDKSSKPTLSTLREILSGHELSELKKYADVLYSWTGKTAYGRLLDRATNVKLTNDLVTIEIKGLDGHPDLKDIFLLLFTSFIKEEAARDLATPYLLIIDEAHRLFRTPSGKEFAIDCYRVFRKYNAGILCISQNYRDFLSDPDLADSLMPNTTNVIILRQRKIDWDDFKQALDLNEAQVEVIKSLEIKKGEYAEFYLMQDESQAVLRLAPDPLSYWICTTDGGDRALIQERIRCGNGQSLLEVLKQLSKGE